jgi:cardiolipin synthase (CMP-forming)
MDKHMTIPNMLSALRIITIPIIVFLILSSNAANYPVLIVVYALSLALDFFDGYLARKLHQESELGKILDPLADKLMVFSTILALVIKADFPLWLAIVIIGRDLGILGVSAILFRGKQVVIPSNLVGKVTFALLGALMMVFIIDLTQAFDLLILKRFLIIHSICFLSWSMLGYYDVYQRVKNA